MKIGLMIEGQNGLTWKRWSHILALAERLGFPTVFRSDHYFHDPEAQHDSLEAYLSFVLAARETKNVRFGPLVTPITFRKPVDIVRMAAQINVLSGGRFVMGLGAGWNEPEHRAYGLPFPSTGERFDRLEDAVNLMIEMWKPGKATYKGRFYSVEGVDCQPRSADRPQILIGGSGEKRTLRLAAQYAEEWNCFGLTADDFAHKKDVLEQHCRTVGRDPQTIRRSMVVVPIVGNTSQDLDKAAQRVMRQFPSRRPRTPEEYRERARERGMIVGGPEEVVEQLGRLAEAGVQEAVFQHIDFDSDEVPEFLASEVMPKVAGL